ncbi:hypothetical protein AB0H88_22560 [Nonomuraea sp. NPDC050680]
MRVTLGLGPVLAAVRRRVYAARRHVYAARSHVYAARLTSTEVEVPDWVS